MERVYILKNRPNGDSSPITAEQVEVLVKEQGTQELEVVQGYFNGTNFYTDALFTTLISPDPTKLYISKNGNLSYRYEVGYVAVGSGSDIIEVANLAALPATGEVAKIYITIDTNLQYRWSGSAYVQIGGSGSSNLLYKLPTPTDPVTGTTSNMNLFTHTFPANTFEEGDYIDIINFDIEYQGTAGFWFFTFYFTNNNTNDTNIFGDGFIKGYALTPSVKGYKVRRGINVEGGNFVGTFFDNPEFVDYNNRNTNKMTQTLNLNLPIYMNVAVALGSASASIILKDLVINKY